MGHWQQIGRDNAAERERRAKLPRWRRTLVSEFGTAILASAWVAIGVLLLRKIGVI